VSHQYEVAHKGKNENAAQAVKATPHINQGKRVTLVPGVVKLFYQLE
jgi:hypothetical protein